MSPLTDDDRQVMRELVSEEIRRCVDRQEIYLQSNAGDALVQLQAAALRLRECARLLHWLDSRPIAPAQSRARILRWLDSRK